MVEGVQQRALELFRRLTRQAPRPALDRWLAVRLREAFAIPGCPLCRLLEEKERRLLPALLWEQVNDPATATRLAASRGFCWEHAWALVPAGAAVHSHLGVALLLERLLRDAYRTCPDQAALHDWLRPRAPCPVCQWLAEAEQTLLLGAAELLRHDPLLLRTQPGLPCRPHAAALFPLLPAALRRTWEARCAAACATWAPDDQLAHAFGRRPWALPAFSQLPVHCPDCSAAPSGDGRLWQWLGTVERVVAQPAPAEQCLGHACQTVPGERWRSDLRQLLDDLAAFIAAHDYRFRGTLTPAQRTSWLRAIARLVGTVPAAGAHERRAPPTV